jgi:hypothetical protein
MILVVVLAGRAGSLMMGELGLWWLRSALDVGLLFTSRRYSCMTYTHTVCERFHCAAMHFASSIKRRGAPLSSLDLVVD